MDMASNDKKKAMYCISMAIGYQMSDVISSDI